MIAVNKVLVACTLLCVLLLDVSFGFKGPNNQYPRSLRPPENSQKIPAVQPSSRNSKNGKDFQLVSSAHGPLKKIMFSMPTYTIIPLNNTVDDDESRETPCLTAIYETFFRDLPSYTEFLILSHPNPQAVARIQDLLRKYNRNNYTIVFAEEDNRFFSLWAEDAYVINYDSNGKYYFTTPVIMPRYSDSSIASWITQQVPNNEFTMHTSPTVFQGGNVLIGDTWEGAMEKGFPEDAFWMIGKDYFHDSEAWVDVSIARMVGETKEKAVYRALTSYLDTKRRLIVVGTDKPLPTETHLQFTKEVAPGDFEIWDESIYYGNQLDLHLNRQQPQGCFQPLFHIDMFITLLGRIPNTPYENKYTVLVASPKMAVEIMGNEVLRQRYPYAMQNAFDEIADQLTNQGFNVLRIPLPMVYIDKQTPEEKAQKTGRRVWYFPTYNNCLVQTPTRAGEMYMGQPVKRKVWVPSYGSKVRSSSNIPDPSNKLPFEFYNDLKKTDDWMANFYSKLGFEFSSMGTDCNCLAQNLGCLHCIKKYLKRN